MANNLKDHLKEVADAIRAKKGTSDLINPQDFATEIEGISGGGDSGGSTIEYLDVSGKPLLEWSEVFGMIAYLVKMPTKISTMSLLMMLGETVNDATAFAIDPTIEFDFQGSRIIAADFCSSFGVDLSTYPRLTKEQFYDLNA